VVFGCGAAKAKALASSFLFEIETFSAARAAKSGKRQTQKASRGAHTRGIEQRTVRAFRAAYAARRSRTAVFSAKAQ